MGIYPLPTLTTMDSELRGDGDNLVANSLFQPGPQLQYGKLCHTPCPSCQFVLGVVRG